MNLKPLAANMTEIETYEYVVLFSYKTPVAYVSKESGECYRTEKDWSRTTTRHINKWFGDMFYPGKYSFTQVPQSVLDNLLNEVK